MNILQPKNPCWREYSYLACEFEKLEDRREEKVKMIILAIIMWLALIFLLARACDLKRILPSQVIIPIVEAKNVATGQILPLVESYEAGIRTVTAYNLIPWQTDDTPCQSANGENICLALELGYKRCASNEFPFGTRLQIQNYGECLVTDRTNNRYNNRIDIAMRGDEIERAKQFGRQTLLVTIIK